MKITGTVRNAETKEPLGETKITLKVGATEIASLYSDARGSFAHEEAADYTGDTLTCTAEKEGFKSKTLTHPIKEEIIPVEIAMEKEAEEPVPEAKFPISPKILIGAGIAIIAIVVIALAVAGIIVIPKILKKVPVPPSGLVATAVSPSQVDLTWEDKSDNEDGFRVYRGDSKIAQVKAGAKSYQDKKVNPDTEYTYVVKAFNKAGESDPSKAFSVRTPPRAGAIAVSSTPSGANVYINDQPKGTTPRTIPDLSPASYTLRVDKTGYQSHQQRVVVKPGETTSISVALKEQVKYDVPVVENVASTSHPAIPSGLKVTCLQGPDTLKSSSTCPVIKWDRYTYWAYSYSDNRVAMAIVAYDPAGKVVRQWNKTGARYVWRITVDTAAKKVTFWGQGNRKIVMKWDELRVPGS